MCVGQGSAERACLEYSWRARAQLSTRACVIMRLTFLCVCMQCGVHVSLPVSPGPEQGSAERARFYFLCTRAHGIIHRLMFEYVFGQGYVERAWFDQMCARARNYQHTHV